MWCWSLALELVVMNNRVHFRIFFFALLVIGLTGCPRYAYIEAYNNTTVDITIDSSGLLRDVAPGQSSRFKFTGNSFQVKSDLGIWRYSRSIPHSGGDGPYFDGTLRVQVNSDGVIYALKAGDMPPLSGFTKQPRNYPLRHLR